MDTTGVIIKDTTCVYIKNTIFCLKRTGVKPNNMKLPYIAKLNQGNEAFNVGQSISVEEKPIGTASSKQIAEHIHMMNGLVPIDVAETVWNLLGDVIIHFMAQGYRVPFKGRGYSLGSMYADVKLKKNLSLADVQAIDPTIQQLTMENFAKFVNPADIVVRAKFETEDKFNERLRAEVEGMDRAGVVEKAYVQRAAASGESPAQPNNPGGGNNGGVNGE